MDGLPLKTACAYAEVTMSSPSPTRTRTRTMTTPSKAHKQVRRTANESRARRQAPRRKSRLSTGLEVADLVTIGITGPELATRTPALRLNQKLSKKDTRPGPEMLAKLPWLQQDRAYRAGYYLLTHGLQQHAKHPEIEMCNVPGAMLEDASRMLNTIAEYVLHGHSLGPGQTLLINEDPLAVVGFMQVEAGTRGTAHDDSVLRVVFLR